MNTSRIHIHTYRYTYTHTLIPIHIQIYIARTHRERERQLHANGRNEADLCLRGARAFKNQQASSPFGKYIKTEQPERASERGQSGHCRGGCGPRPGGQSAQLGSGAPANQRRVFCFSCCCCGLSKMMLFDRAYLLCCGYRLAPMGFYAYEYPDFFIICFFLFVLFFLKESE